MAPRQLSTLLHRLGLFGGGRAPAVPVTLPDPSVELGSVWAGLAPEVRAAVRDPVRRLARAGRQTDPTTCGSAVLVMLAAAGDPGLALWLVSGRLPEDRTGDRRPPELAAAPTSRLAALSDAPAEHRFAVLQRVVKHRTGAGALLGLPWPGALGTPPWTAAREARFGGVRFADRVVDDTDPPYLTVVLDEVAAALARGVPVPLYTGGDTAQRWSAAVPRHVVLALPASRADTGAPGARTVDALTVDALTVWEPSAGRVVAITRAELVAGRPHPALGGWSHLAWALLPRG